MEIIEFEVEDIITGSLAGPALSTNETYIITPAQPVE